MIVVVLFGAVLAVVLALLGLRDLASLFSTRARLIAAASGTSEANQLPLVERYDRLLRSTRVGRSLERELQLAGLDRLPLVILGAGVRLATRPTDLPSTPLHPAQRPLGPGPGARACPAARRRHTPCVSCPVGWSAF